MVVTVVLLSCMFSFMIDWLVVNWLFMMRLMGHGLVLHWFFLPFISLMM